MLEASAYTTGPFNQYTAIERGEESVFEPVYDADGNQTLIRTSTGIWQVAYNAENRPCCSWICSWRKDRCVNRRCHWLVGWYVNYRTCI